MYTHKNYKTKKQLKEDVLNGVKVTVYQPNDMFGNGNIREGSICIEGPHYPEPHRWYASATLKDGYVVKVS